MELSSKYDNMSREDFLRLLVQRDAEEQGALRLHYKGETPPWQIIRRVRPRCQRIDQKLSFGSENDQAANLLIEGDNLQTMVSLYKYRGQVDLVLTDPPYNTGNDFRYNDKWDVDPNDTDLGAFVPADDGSRHSKWLRFMVPRLWMMREMLKPGGVLAICIDHRELFRLGMVLDEMFGENNRLAILNWQKTYAPKKTNHVATATEYILVYAKNESIAKTRHLERGDAMNSRFTNIDGDPLGAWRAGDLAAKEKRDRTMYAIQSPFTGRIHYPEGEHEFGSSLSVPTRHWSGFTKKELLELLGQWGSEFIERDIGDGRGAALVLKNSSVAIEGYTPETDPAVKAAQKIASKIYKSGLAGKSVLPRVLFSDDRQRNLGAGRPVVKRHLEHIKQGKIPWTYWADEVYEDAVDLGAVSWPHTESGHSQAGVNELDSIVGRGHGFETVKPLKLFKKIIQIWCRPEGIVLDPFAGSGTTGHAVLELNQQAGTNRRFVLIEQGRPERGDSYARTLTAERLTRAITGERVDKRGVVSVTAEPATGGFMFSKLTSKVDATAVLSLQREEMLDLLVTSHWDQNERSGVHLRRLPASNDEHLFARSSKNEGYFLIWNGPEQASVLNRSVFREITDEATKHGLTPPFHVYARTSLYPGPNINFYQIPDRILEKLGFNEATQSYAQREDSVE